MKNISIKETIKVFWDHTMVYKGVAIGVLAFSIFRTGFDLIIPFLSKRFFDVLVEETITPETVRTLVGVLVAILAVELLVWASARLREFTAITQQTRIMADLKESAFEYMNQHSYRFFTNSFAGSLVRRVNRLSRSYETTADRITYDLIPLFITILGALFAIGSRHVVLGIALFLWTILFVALNVVVSRWKQPHEIERAKRDTAATGVLADSITNNITAKLFSGLQHENSLYKDVIQRWRSGLSFVWHLNHFIDATQALLMIGINFLVMYLAVGFWQKGLLTIGDFVLIQAFLLTLFHQLWSVGRVLRNLYEAFADAQEMVDILNTPHEVQDHPRATELRVSRGEVKFDNVTFAYHKTRRVLEGFNLTITPGERVALVGPSGAGKSTVTQLLLRFHDINRGLITIDEKDIARVTQDSLREQIAFVPQEPLLFHRTLMENIRYGRRDASDQEVIEAARKAHCHEFIERLPEGYDTYVGERGVKLSGGERQRVAIARAILKDAPILVLDEATSSLDSESEAYIQEALAKLMEGKTTIVIAHRLSTIMKMDRIVVIDEGKVVTSGTHTELIQGEGIYKKLWEIQAGGFLD